MVSIVEVDHCSTRFDPAQQLHMKGRAAVYTCVRIRINVYVFTRAIHTTSVPNAWAVYFVGALDSGRGGKTKEEASKRRCHVRAMMLLQFRDALREEGAGNLVW